MNRFLAFILCILVLAACGGGREQKPDAVAATRLKAAELSEKAAFAYQKFDYELALNYYREALRLSRSVEDFESMAVGAINTAATLRAIKQLDEADQLLDEFLQARYMRMSHDLEAEAQYLKARIMLDRKDAAGAIKQAKIALEVCGKGCDALARIYNLSSRALFEADDNRTARKQAQAGLQASHADGDGREEANSLRLLGELDEDEGQYENASGHFEQALVIDKKLALGPKIYLDLMGMGRVAAKLGDTSKAVGYYNRALSVAEALGDRDKAGQAKSGLEAVQNVQENQPVGDAMPCSKCAGFSY